MFSETFNYQPDLESTKKVEQLLMLKLLAKVQENERTIVENLQKDYNEYAETVRTYQNSYQALLRLLTNATRREQITRSSQAIREGISTQLQRKEIDDSLNFLERNGDFQKQRDFHCGTEQLPIATTLDVVENWRRDNAANGVDFSKLESYVGFLKDSIHKIDDIISRSYVRVRTLFKRLLDDWCERFDLAFLRDE